VINIGGKARALPSIPPNEASLVGRESQTAAIICIEVFRIAEKQVTLWVWNAK
jgi:hypothetical protein